MKEEMASFDGSKLTPSSATLHAINRYMRDVTVFIKMLGWAGNYKTRREIKMSDADMQEYFAKMSREVTTLAIDAVLTEAFLMMQDDKAARRPWWERILTGRWRRATLLQQWDRWTKALKRRIVIMPGWGGEPAPAILDGEVKVDESIERANGKAAAVADAGGGEAVHGEPEHGAVPEDAAQQGDEAGSGAAGGAVPGGEGREVLPASGGGGTGGGGNGGLEPGGVAQ